MAFDIDMNPLPSVPQLWFYAGCLDCDAQYRSWDDLPDVERWATLHEEGNAGHIVHVFYPT